MAYRGTPPRDMRKSADNTRKSTDWGFSSTGSAGANGEIAPGSWSRPSILAAMAGKSGGESDVILGKPVVHQGYLAKRGEKSQTNTIARMVIPRDHPPSVEPVCDLTTPLCRTSLNRCTWRRAVLSPSLARPHLSVTRSSPPGSGGGEEVA